MPTLKRAALICAPLGSFATSSNLPHAVLQKQNPISGGESAFRLFSNRALPVEHTTFVGQK